MNNISIIFQIQQHYLSNMILMFTLIFIVFYFFIIRPQLSKQKLDKIFIENIKKGDKIVTISGIHGKILDINKKNFTIETLSGKIKFEVNSISRELTLSNYSFLYNLNKK